MLLSACGGGEVKKETNTEGENMNKTNKVTIVNPHMYSAWPYIGLSNDKLVCIYTVADQHVATTSGLYMKSSSDGVNWSDVVEIFKDKTGVKGITGVGYDNDGNMLLWYRSGSPAVATTTFELFKIDGDNITPVSKPNINVNGGHIGNIVRTPNNELWAFYNTYGDFRSWGYVKSADNGLTWEQVEVEKDIYKAACPAELECAFISDDKIIVLGRKDVADATVAMFQIESSDNGKTWGDALDGKHSPAPKGAMCSWSDITNVFYSAFMQRGEEGFDKYRVQSLFVGSGKLTQSKTIKVGTHYRVYAPVWTKNHGNRVLYTDDFGQTWHALGGKTALPCPRGDEPKCEELPDGSVVLSSRKGAGRFFNIYKYSDDPKKVDGAWGDVVASDQQRGGIKVGRNSTNGEILILRAQRKADGAQRTIALQSLPTGDGRSDVKIYWKDITEAASYASPKAFAEEWNQQPYQVSHTGSAYSTMTLQKDGRIGFFYEEEPGWYSMVYVPISLEAITNGLYGVK